MSKFQFVVHGVKLLDRLRGWSLLSRIPGPSQVWVVPLTGSMNQIMARTRCGSVNGENKCGGEIKSHVLFDVSYPVWLTNNSSLSE